jgi:hypothetical protein
LFGGSGAGLGVGDGEGDGDGCTLPDLCCQLSHHKVSILITSLGTCEGFCASAGRIVFSNQEIPFPCAHCKHPHALLFLSSLHGLIVFVPPRTCVVRALAFFGHSVFGFWRSQI